MKNLFRNHVVRLIAGNLAAAVLVVGLPAVIVLRTVGTWDWAPGVVATLLCVHVGLLAIQVASSGQPVPTKWNAACFLPLPVIDSAATVSFLQAGLFGWSLVCLLMTAGAAFIVVCMVLQIWQRMRLRDQMIVVIPTTKTRTETEMVPADDPTVPF